MPKEDFISAMSFLGEFFGNKKNVVPAPAERARHAAPPQPPAAPPVADERVHPDAILQREEIIDAHNRLCGYRFMPKALIEHRPYPEPLFFEALREDRVIDFAQRRKAVIPISADGMVFGRHQALKAPNTYFLLDVRQASLPREELLGRLAALHDGGFRTALSGVGLSQDDHPLLESANLVFLELAEYPLPNLQATVRQMRSLFPALELAAVGVQSWAEQRMCLAWGFTYCLGDFLSSRDEEEEEGSLNESQLASMEMLNQLRREAELDELAAVAKRDPGLTFHLLKWANSPATGLAHAVTSVNQAIMVLGRAQMVRWLMVAMFRMGHKHDRDEALLEIALARARCLETLVAPRLAQHERDELFLIGLLSLFDILLHMSMSRVLSQMHLSDDVVDVLLRSAGPYAPYLMLALAMEKGRVNQVTELANRLGIPVETLQATQNAAFVWAQEAIGASHAH